MKNKTISVLLGVLLVTTLLNCTSDNDFKKVKTVLEKQGYKNIENTGYSIFCCSSDDSFSTGFRAISNDGEIVEGCACSSLLGGVNIKFK